MLTLVSVALLTMQEAGEETKQKRRKEKQKKLLVDAPGIRFKGEPKKGINFGT